MPHHAVPSSSFRLVRRAPAALALLALCALPPGLAAQVPGGGVVAMAGPVRTPAWRADSIAVAGDSAAALALLDSAIRADRDDAEAWHRRGLIAWRMARSQRSASFMKDGTAIKRIALADSSLRMAVMLRPDSARYGLELGRFFLNSGYSILRWQAAGHFEKALAAAERTGDPWQIAEVADELGMVYWRRYEVSARRVMTTGSVGSISPGFLDTLAQDLPGRSKDFLDNFVVQRDGKDFAGELDYGRARELFDRALRAMPEHPRAMRHRFMVLAEREQWEELLGLAQPRTKVAPWDAQAHFALGLAAHRLDRPALAEAAFDSALALIEPAERARLTSLARILRAGVKPKGRLTDSAGYAAASAAEREQLDSLYWQVADPMSLTPQNEHRLEFLARVTHAELVWTSDDLDRKGADSDRGEVWIRYGPPPVRLGFPSDGRAAQPSEYWRYADGLSFVFIKPPAFGTARYAPDSRTRVEMAKASAPVNWSNVAIGASIDSITVQVARFRASGDSADVFLAAELPIDGILKGVDLARAPVDVGFGIWTGPSTVLVRDSTRVMIAPGDENALPRLRAWRERLPAGAHVYRVEALQPDAMRGGRALGSVRLAAETGFGTSDLLVAARAMPKSDVAPTRWRDLNLLPSAGRFARGEPIALVWETYGLAAAPDGGTKYRVALTLERKFDSRTGAFAASVISGVAGVTGMRATERRGRITLTFDRSGPPTPVAVEYLTLDVGNAAAGRYEVSVTVTDLVTKQVVSKKREIRIQ